ncbi:DNA invertase [Marivivens niveibacter]|uniref:DNA invertase n=1 Tax=Marivivens niveibacter TaxID=1930667 RepID=A0A251X0C4_9RHOB|nr:recombinase family protein [Marivivens niveibacter]OUD10011.1 DNA invertase [Marivivens niveibacter]
MLVGYARTSTSDQTAGLEAQLKVLKDAGCERIYEEQVSSVDARARERLAECLSFIREGDTLVVTKLDRLARSVSHLGAIRDELGAKGAELRIIDLNMDTNTPTGKLMINLLGSIAEFEREIMLERQREGIAKAKALGRYKGRKPIRREIALEVQALREKGTAVTEIAKRVGISRATTYRILSRT